MFWWHFSGYWDFGAAPPRHQLQTSNYLVGGTMNVGCQKLTAKSLEEPEQRLANIIDFLPDATFAIDGAGKVIIWNRAIEEMVGVKAQNILGKENYEYAIPFYGIRRPQLIDLVLNPDKKLPEKAYLFLVKKDRRVFAETKLPIVKGQNLFLWGMAGPLYDNRGNVVGAIESIRDITKLKNTELELEKMELDLRGKNCELESLNSALRVLLRQRDEERNMVEEKIQFNINLLVLPSIELLKAKADIRTKSLINILLSNLRDITSPFAQKLSTQFLNLTNKEVQIANLIKEGKSTKEIATFLSVSVAAINLHRYRIRKKLCLTKSQNLQSYLSALS